MALAERNPLRELFDRVRDDANNGDGELLTRYRTLRDQDAFGSLVRRHGPMVLGVCNRVLRDSHAADDAFQATFLVLAKKADAVRPPERLAPWLYGVAYRTAMKARGRAFRQQQVEQQYAIEIARRASASSDETSAVLPLIDEQLNALPEKYRAPLVLCAMQGLNKAEAAERLGLPEGTVSSRLARAREMLRDRLARRGVIVPAVAFEVLLCAKSLHAAVPTALAASATQIAVGSAVVPATVLTLSHEVMRSMFLLKLKPLCAVALSVTLVSSGFGMFVMNVDENKPQPVTADEKKPQPEPEKVKQPAPVEQRSDAENLKQIGMAIHNYIDAKGHLPHDILDKNGKPLLSWRVAILPYIEQDALYKKFKLDEAWDSPNNKQWSQVLVKMFLSPNAKLPEKPEWGLTSYRGISGPNVAFELGKKVRVTNFSDGTAYTIMVIETDPLVPWAKPVDYSFDAEKQLPNIEPAGKMDRFQALFADGSVHAIQKKTSEKTLKALFTRDGGEFVHLDPVTNSASALLTLVVVSVDVKEYTLTIAYKTDIGVDERVMTLADDAKILVDGRSAKLSDVPKKSVVTFAMPSSNKIGTPTMSELHVSTAEKKAKP